MNKATKVKEQLEMSQVVLKDTLKVPPMAECVGHNSGKTLFTVRSYK